MSRYQTNVEMWIRRWRVIACCLLFASCADSGPITRTAFSQLRAAKKKVDAGGSVYFTDQLIMAGYAYTYGIGLGDLDGDGDLDITSADATPHNKLYWFKNDGKGSFQKHLIQENDPQRLERHWIGDINEDGHPDVAIVKNLAGDLLWFANSGKPRDGQLWKRHVITQGKLPGAYDLVLLDVDRDGDLDAAASSWRLGNQFAWFENDGTPAKGEWSKHLIEDNVGETRTIRTADFDGDGDPDLLGTGRVANLVVWYENASTRTSTAWKKHVIDDQSHAPAHGQPVDMDKDGDVDIVMALGMVSKEGVQNTNQVAWYENDGSPAEGPWKKHLIHPSFHWGIEAAAADLDGDGDVDVVATSWYSKNGLAWFENHGDPKRQWTMHVLRNDWKTPNQVLIGDLNGDGRPDIVSADEASKEVHWFRNEGRRNAGPARPIDIGSRVELFVDDYLIDSLDGGALKLHKPTPREVVIVHDAPWEGSTSHGHVVFQDGSLYRMYYRASEWDETADDHLHYSACYAESKDGIHWTKPELGLYQFHGSKRNNIVFMGRGRQNFAPLKDANPDCSPDARYKALAGVAGDGGIWTFQSPDGIHWSPLSRGPVITHGAFDSVNLAFWDTTRKRYVDFHRGFRDGYRDVLTCTSTDFRNWTQPVFLEYPDAPPEHLYTNSIAPYYRAPHIFIGFPKRFLPSRNPTRHFKRGTSDVLLMSSRDGRTFRRWGEAVIRPGLQKSRWVNRNNYVAWGVVVTKSDIPDTPDELSIYSIEGYYVGKSCQLRRYTYRIDGFASVQASLAGGEMVTKPLVFDGDRLIINFSTSAAGSVRVEIQDAEGTPIEGYRLDESTELFGDEIGQPVTWKAGADISRLAGKPVRFRFVMKDADLYSIQTGKR